MTQDTEIIGAWQRTEKRLSAEVVTRFTFSEGGSYAKSLETTFEIPTPYGPLEDTVCDSEEGEWVMLGSSKLELKSTRTGRTIKPVRLRNGTLRIGSQEFTRINE